jgi:hypothetical protein
VLGRFGDGGHEIGLSNVLVKVDATVGKLAEGSLLLELCVREVWSARFCPQKRCALPPKQFPDIEELE